MSIVGVGKIMNNTYISFFQLTKELMEMIMIIVTGIIMIIMTF